MLSGREAAAVKVGDRVGFKSDVEQYSEVYGIMQNPHGPGLLFQVNVTEGEYGRGFQWIEAERCWRLGR